MSAMVSSQLIARIGRLEHIIGHDPANRRAIAPLIEAARGGLLAAAQSLHEHPAPNVCIMTGFYLAHGEPPACETDGPPGAIHLAAGLERAGIPCRLVTDTPNIGAVRAAANAVLRRDFPIDVAAVPGFPGGDEISVLEAQWTARPPSHVIAIERCGASADDTPRNSSGADMTAHNAPLDRLFMAGDWTRIAIGDGGNEIGMGSLPAGLIAKHVARGAQIACVVPCDHLIVSGVSNWGAIGLLCALALIRPAAAADLTASLTPQTDRRILENMVLNGPAVAIRQWGSAKAPEPALAVDGLPWEYHANILTDMLETLAMKHGDKI